MLWHRAAGASRNVASFVRMSKRAWAVAKPSVMLAHKSTGPIGASLVPVKHISYRRARLVLETSKARPYETVEMGRS